MDSTYGLLAGAAPAPMIWLTTSLGIRTEPVTRFGDLFPLFGTRGVRLKQISRRRSPWQKFCRALWNDESGQDIAEYAVMLAVILVIVVGTIRLIGSNANNVFSNVGSAHPVRRVSGDCLECT